MQEGFACLNSLVSSTLELHFVSSCSGLIFKISICWILCIGTWKTTNCSNDAKSNYNPIKCLRFIVPPFLQRDRIAKPFQQNTSSSYITIERKNLYMKRSACIWIVVHYPHGSCVKGKNISVTPSKAGTVSSQVVLLWWPAEVVVAFS